VCIVGCEDPIDLAEGLPHELKKRLTAPLAMAPLYEATVGRAFTAWYGAAMRLIDGRGLREIRRQLLADAQGRVLDIGAGTGANLPLFPDTVDELVLSEPDLHMLAVLERRIGSLGFADVDLLRAPAEALPFEDKSFDYVTCTMVICTMPDPWAGLAEIARILKPGGRFLFLEHVRSAEPRIARRQDRLERPWRFLADGCHCNRDSLAIIEASPLALERVRHGEMPLAPHFIKPLLIGSAIRKTG
jgi:SAM-dependent methyltransferase